MNMYQNHRRLTLAKFRQEAASEGPIVLNIRFHNFSFWESYGRFIEKRAISEEIIFIELIKTLIFLETVLVIETMSETQSNLKPADIPSCLQLFCKKGVFTGKHLCSSLLYVSFIKKRHRHRCVSLNLAKYFRINILR